MLLLFSLGFHSTSSSDKFSTESENGRYQQGALAFANN
ncbi:hypothetical protein B4102_0295 [Heyndrickxia sporothermodurans]|uniref:Uncharacterized protein n=1 Tax=Heyndrickxia sporothermodurans TaxID=46224 RepID=A0A150KSB6_9BACI|nr:hypothetical protein B4102_0295 [Heyndrickxia sporothermodurans]